MAADGSTFYVPRYRALVKPVGRFWRTIHQNACFGTKREGPFGVQKDRDFSVHPENRQKPNFGALSMHFLRKTKMLITFEP